MRRLSGGRELLDGPLDAKTLAGNLRDLRRLNDWLGGSALTRTAVEPLLAECRDPYLTLLDVGTGAADIPRLLRRSTANRAPGLHITATDVRPEIVEIARRAAANPGFEVRLAAADRIDEPDGSFDIVHSSLLLHHFDPSEPLDDLRGYS